MGHTRRTTRERIEAIRNGDVDLYEHLPYGPSRVTRGAVVGYHAGPTRLTREHVQPEQRRHAADTLAAWSLPGTNAADPQTWLDRFEAYDAIDEYEIPSAATAASVSGARSVNREALNLDLDHQPLSYTIHELQRNEELARTPGPYRRSADPQRQAVLDEAWDARADRLRQVREQLERIDARASARRDHGATDGA
ncbi:MAG: hypothetical protein V4737_08640 [Curtobacterium sp.]